MSKNNKSKEELEFEASRDETIDALWVASLTGHETSFKSYVQGFAILIPLGLINYWIVMTVFKITPINWYLKNGALIGLVTSIVATIWGDINRNIGLISTHPKTYVGACANLLTVPFYSLKTHAASNDNRNKPRSSLNFLLAFPFILIIIGLLLAWIIVVVPLQYIIFFICGAPARDFLRSKWRPIAGISKTGKLEIKKILKSEEIPNGWWDVSLFDKPVSFTCLMSSGVFLVVEPLLS